MNIKSHPTSQIVPSISELRALFNGRVIAPDDPRYEQARTVFYGGIDRHPAAIVRVADAGDVSRLVSWRARLGSSLPFAAVDTATQVIAPPKAALSLIFPQ